MNNREIAHLWAHQARDSARGSHFYFEGDTIYSYGSHFPIARHYKGVVLFTAHDYSVTTAKHKSFVRYACNHLRTFVVDRVLDNPSEKDVRDYAAQIKDRMESVSRARDPQVKLARLKALVEEANDFCERFGFSTRFSMPDDETLQALERKSKLAAAKKAEATKKRNARIEQENAQAIQEWIAGVRNSLPWNIQSVHLRQVAAKDDALSSGGSLVMETSKGVTVPIDEAQRAFRFCMIARAKGWRRNGDQFKVGDYQLDAVNDFGVIAGCHRIAWPEIERFAKAQQWIA